MADNELLHEILKQQGELKQIIEDRFDELDLRLNGIDAKLVSYDRQLRAIENRLKAIEDYVAVKH